MSAPPASRTSSVSPGLVVGGYLCALFLPIVGIVLGMSAIKKYDGVGTNHGHWIIGLSIASVLVGLLMIASSSG